MRFIVNSQVLLKHLQAVGGVISTNTSMPILENYLFDLRGSELSIIGSNAETTIMVTLEVESNEEGRVAIPSKMLQEIVKTFPDMPMVFQIDNDTFGVEISVGEDGNYKLAGEDPAAYTEIPMVEGELGKTELPADLLSSAISKTVFATGNDALRMVMSGVYFELSPENLTFVATDAHKLVRYRRTDAHAAASGHFIVPKRALMQLKNVLSLRKENVPVSLVYNDRNVFFSFEKVQVICRLIDGKYPNYDAVIPKDNPHRLTIDRASFLTALRRIAIFAEQSVPQARLKISGKELLLSAEDVAKSNAAKEKLACQFEGEPIEIGFNAKFLIEMLNNIETEEVCLAMSHPSRAGILLPVNNADEAEDILMLVMPVAL